MEVVLLEKFVSVECVMMRTAAEPDVMEHVVMGFVIRIMERVAMVLGALSYVVLGIVFLRVKRRVAEERFVHRMVNIHVRMDIVAMKELVTKVSRQSDLLLFQFLSES